MEDTLWSSLTDSYIKTPMALTAERLAEEYGITREECDEQALRSQQRWAAGGLRWMSACWCSVLACFKQWLVSALYISAQKWLLYC